MANIKELIQSIESGDSSFDEKLAAINQMEETLVAMREQEQEAVNDNVELIVEAIKLMEKKVADQLEIAKSIVPEKGDKGDKGQDGLQGRDGLNGKDGRDGQDGKNGLDGSDGVSVTDAKIDFDGSLIITLSTGREINVGEVVAPDLVERLNVISTMSTNTAVANITSGTINNTTIGATTPSIGVFTTLTAQNETLKGTGQNLNTFSQDFSNAAWTKILTIISGTLFTAPDGTTTANKVTATTTGTSLRQVYQVGKTLTTTSYTFSFYAKAAELSWVKLNAFDGTNRQTYFDLTNGTVGAVASGDTASISSAGSGWYRCSVTRTASSTVIGGLSIEITSGNNVDTPTLTAGNGIYVWGAQLELASSVGTYIPTTTTAVYGTPTLSFSGVASIGLQSDGSLYETSAGTGNVRFYTNNIGQEQARVSHTASAVNYHQLTGSATGSGPIHSVAGSDTNIDLNLTTKGTGAVNLNTGGGTQVQVSNTASAVNYVELTGGPLNNAPTIGAKGSNTNISFAYSSKGTGGHDFYTSGTSFTQQVKISHTASAVNYVQVTGGTTGSVNGATISSQGSDADVNLRVVPKGAGYLYVRQDSTASTGILLQNRSSTGSPEMGIRFITGGFDLSDSRYAEISSTGGGSNTLIFKTGNGTSPQEFLRIAANGDMTLGGSNTAPNFKIVRNGSAINFLQVTGAATGFGPLLSAQGTDTNIPLVLQPKGTGALQAQQTDSTATGGNARGANAVDWQTAVRDLASRVASGSLSVLGGGQYNTVSGGSSVVSGGIANTNSGAGAVIVGGYGNTNSSSNHGALLGGYTNSVSGQWAVVGGGYTNTAAGFYNFIGGGYTNSGTSASAVTTQSSTMNGTTAVTLSGSNANIKVGQLISGTSITSFPATYVAAISGTSLTLSQAASGSSTSTLSFYTPHGVVVGGGNNQATGSYSFIGGGGDAGTAANRNVASGDWSVVVGGAVNNIGSGHTHGFIGSGRNNTFSGSGSFSSIVGGTSHTVTGSYGSIVGGYGATSNSNYGTVLNGSGGTSRSITGNLVFSASDFPLGGVSSGFTQSAFLILARQTTDATATVLTSTSGGAGTTNQVILPNNSAYYFKGSVIANVTGGGNTKAWVIEGAIKRGANAASTALVGTPTVTSGFADAGASTWAIAVTADTTNGGLAVTFTGQASTTIRCVAKLETVEVTF